MMGTRIAWACLLAADGFEQAVTNTGTWVKGEKQLVVTMPENVQSRDLCAAKLGDAGQVVGFLNAAAKKSYIKDQAEQLKKQQ